MKVIVHSKLPGECEFCDRVKNYLARLKIPYEVVEHATQTDRNAIYDRYKLEGGQRTMPQVVLQFDDGADERIGGFIDTLSSNLHSRYKKEAAAA